MFIGHYAVGMASKKIVPKVSLGTLFLAVQLVDLLWPLFLLIGIEHVRIDPGNTVVTPLDFYDYPFTHSLLGAIYWSEVHRISVSGCGIHSPQLLSLKSDCSQRVSSSTSGQPEPTTKSAPSVSGR